MLTRDRFLEIQKIEQKSILLVAQTFLPQKGAIKLGDCDTHFYCRELWTVMPIFQVKSLTIGDGQMVIFLRNQPLPFFVIEAWANT
jgi:hypothetical protein